MSYKRTINPEAQARSAAASRTVEEFTRLAAEDPEQAIRKADFIKDLSARASALIAISKRIREIGPLHDARDILASETKAISSRVENRKLAQIAFGAVGIDNGFAAETTNFVTAPASNLELRQQLSVAMIDSISTVLMKGEVDDLNRYPEFVMAAFHESIGDSSYFGDVKSWTETMRAPKYLTAAIRHHPLDPATDGALALLAFRDTPYEQKMENFIVTHAPYRPDF